MPNDIIIYTDGSCLGNPGPGGWAAILKSGDQRKELSEGFRRTTNNRMEFLAFIEALKAIKSKNRKIKIYSDSNLLVQTLNKGWLKSWKSRAWKKSNKKTPENLDLLIEIDELNEKYKPEINWVKAHAGNEENEICDMLAKKAAENPTKIDFQYEKLEK